MTLVRNQPRIPRVTNLKPEVSSLMKRAEIVLETSVYSLLARDSFIEPAASEYVTKIKYFGQ
jgi:hypothetical protein